jgi:hypothetical protein
LAGVVTVDVVAGGVGDGLEPREDSTVTVFVPPPHPASTSVAKAAVRRAVKLRIIRA